MDELKSTAEVLKNFNEAALNIENESKSESPRSKMSFGDRAESMGLIEPTSRVYNYRDKFSKVSYRKLSTPLGEILPILAVYAGPPEGDIYKYTGTVSDSYEFVGNEIVIDKIKQCIKDDGEPIVKEYPMMNSNYVQLYDEIVISNSKNIPQAGDIYPQLIISNAYNGTRAVNIAFGLSISDGTTSRYGFGFRTKLGTLRQVHISSSGTTLRAGIGNYVQGFHSGIVDLVKINFDRKFTEDDVFNALGLVEKLGKRKRDDVSKLLNDMMQEGKSSFWDLFHIIVKFSSTQKNINSKLFLENIAERMLVLPNQMLNLVK